MHACMYSHQVNNSNGGLVLGWLFLRTSATHWAIVLVKFHILIYLLECLKYYGDKHAKYIETAVVYMKSTLSTNSYSYVVVVCT